MKRSFPLFDPDSTISSVTQKNNAKNEANHHGCSRTARHSGTAQADLSDTRVELGLYRGGHMFYTWSASRVDFTADAEAFYMARSNQGGE